MASKVFSKRTKIIALVLGIILVAGGTTGLLIWIFYRPVRPLTTEQWLNLFEQSLYEDRTSQWQGREKKITLYSDSLLVADYEQIYEIETKEADLKSYFYSKETYYIPGVGQLEVNRNNNPYNSTIA